MPRPLVEGNPLEPDLNLRGAKNTLARSPTAVRRYSRSRKRRILLVHGYNVSLNDAQVATTHFRHALGEGCAALREQILTVSWPGDADWLHGGPMAYSRKVPVAVEAGKLLQNYFEAEYDDGDGAEELVIVAHSLGCRLALECLAGLRERPPGLKRLVVILMAAAVPVHLEKLISDAKRLGEIVVLHSDADSVLSRWFRLGQTVAGEGRMPEAIGLNGNPIVPPWSFERRMSNYDHGDYWTGTPTTELVADLLERFFDDIVFRKNVRENRIEERRFLDEVDLLATRRIVGS